MYASSDITGTMTVAVCACSITVRRMGGHVLISFVSICNMLRSPLWEREGGSQHTRTLTLGTSDHFLAGGMCGLMRLLAYLNGPQEVDGVICIMA